MPNTKKERELSQKETELKEQIHVLLSNAGINTSVIEEVNCAFEEAQKEQDALN